MRHLLVCLVLLSVVAGTRAEEPEPGMPDLIEGLQAADRALAADDLDVATRDRIQKRLKALMQEPAVTDFLRTEILRRMAENALDAGKTEQGTKLYHMLLYTCSGRVNLNWITARLKLAALEEDVRRRTLAYLQLYYLLKGTVPRLALDDDLILHAEGGEYALYGPLYAETMNRGLYRKQVLDMALNAMHGLRMDFEGAVDKGDRPEAAAADRRLARLIERSGVLEEDLESRFWMEAIGTGK